MSIQSNGNRRHTSLFEDAATQKQIEITQTLKDYMQSKDPLTAKQAELTLEAMKDEWSSSPA